jgi:hypothetical protein
MWILIGFEEGKRKKEDRDMVFSLVLGKIWSLQIPFLR